MLAVVRAQIMLNSLHKYQPRIHVMKVVANGDKKTVATYSFPRRSSSP